MIELVTMEEAKGHLRIDGDDGDDDLRLNIQIGSAVILRRIRGVRDDIVDADGMVIDGEILRVVQGALLVLLGWMDRNRGGEDEALLKSGDLPDSVKMILGDLICPTIV